MFCKFYVAFKCLLCHQVFTNIHLMDFCYLVALGNFCWNELFIRGELKCLNLIAKCCKLLPIRQLHVGVSI